ncbi:hypothetical protein J1614_007859 [Plenodomus biglobosus]|nr:hypothetical protein J1614_007859 [Plenodomus biglobosus]
MLRETKGSEYMRCLVGGFEDTLGGPCHQPGYAGLPGLPARTSLRYCTVDSDDARKRKTGPTPPSPPPTAGARTWRPGMGIDGAQTDVSASHGRPCWPPQSVPWLAALQPPSTAAGHVAG